MKNIGLYIVTDSDILEGRDFYEAIEETLKAGTKIIQLREKNKDGKGFLERALKLRVLTRVYNAKLIINDRVDIALLSDADGVHVGQSDIEPSKVRKLIGKDKILGVSVRTLNEAIEAKNNSADYLGIGAMFNTTTKEDAKEVSNKELIRIKRSVDLPIVAIGGLKLDNIEKIEPCDGYAVISSILSKEDIEKESRMWIEKIKKITA